MDKVKPDGGGWQRTATDGGGWQTEELPSADVVEVVRCKDCKHWWRETNGMIDHYECAVFCDCYGRGCLTNADDYCSYGEMKEK